MGKIAEKQQNSYKIKVSGPGTLKNGLPAPSLPYMRHAAARGGIYLIITVPDGGAAATFINHHIPLKARHARDRFYALFHLLSHKEHHNLLKVDMSYLTIL